MGVLGSISHREGQRSDFFGPSSTLRFLSQARPAMSRGGPSPECDWQKNAMLGIFQDEAISVGECSSSSPVTQKLIPGLPGHEFSISPRSQADALLESYWIKFHSLYPILHRPSFTEKYVTLWTPSPRDQFAQDTGSQRESSFYDDLDDRSFHCLLNLVFAFGSRFSTMGDGSDRASTFFGRAKVLIDFDMLAQGNIYLVQMLILMGLYLQSTDMMSACWNMVGLAIRVAQGIGLHQRAGLS
ncbi:fungal-specific transcription factor domain-containing protein [Aspergillus floccosus]